MKSKKVSSTTANVKCPKPPAILPLLSIKNPVAITTPAMGHSTVHIMAHAME